MSSPANNGSPRFRLPFLILIVCLAASLATYAFLEHRAESFAEHRFADRADALGKRLSDRLAHAELLLRGAGSFAAAHPDMTHDAWDTFVAGMGVRDQAGATATGVGFMQRVDAAHLDDFVAQRRKSTSGFQVWPPGKRQVYFPYAFIHQPGAQTRFRPLGMDPYAEPVHRAALDRALAAGDLAYTDIVHLGGIDPITHAAMKEKELALLLYAPVIRAGAGARPNEHLGFVSLAIRLRPLLAAIVGPENDVNLELALSNPNTSAPQTLRLGDAPVAAKRP